MTVKRAQETTMFLLKLPVFACVLGLGTSAVAAEIAAPFTLSSTELDKMLETPSNGSATGTLPLGDKAPRALVIRRTESGSAEIHEAFNDLFIVRSGTATVKVGGTASGNRQVSAGEWRGGTIIGATDHKVGPGDVVWIPAGAPHQVIVDTGGDFAYFALKSRKWPSSPSASAAGDPNGSSVVVGK